MLFRLTFILCLTAALVLAACRPAQDPLDVETVPATGMPAPTATAPSATTGTVTPAATLPDPTAALVAEAERQLAEKLGLTSAEVTVFSVTPVDWPDAGLGCPATGVAYDHVVTPGYEILLEAGGAVYAFHTDQGQRVVLCATSTPGEIFNPP